MFAPVITRGAPCGKLCCIQAIGHYTLLHRATFTVFGVTYQVRDSKGNDLRDVEFQFLVQDVRNQRLLLEGRIILHTEISAVKHLSPVESTERKHLVWGGVRVLT